MSDLQTFQGADNNVYHLGHIRLGDIAGYHKWAQFHAWQAFQSMKDKIDPATFTPASNALLIECSKKTTAEVSEEVSQLLNTTEGNIYMVYLSLKHNHPGLTPEKTGEIVSTQNLKEVIDKINILSAGVAAPLDDAKKNNPSPLI